jgi:hypothetical protein
MIEPSWILLGLLLPAMIAGASVRTQAFSFSKPTSRLSPHAWALGIGVGAAAGMLADLGFPPWNPIEAHHWLLIAVVPAAAVGGIINAIPHVPQAVHWLLRITVSFGTVLVLLQSQLSRWTMFECISHIGGLGMGVFIIWALVRRYSQRSGRLTVFILGATAGAIGGCTIASGSIIGGQLTASLAAAIGGGWLATEGISIVRYRGGGLVLDEQSIEAVSRCERWLASIFGSWMILAGRSAGPAVTRGAVDVMFPPIFGFLIYGWYFVWQMERAASPHIVAGLLALTPLGIWASFLPWMRNRPAWQRTALALAMTFLMIIAALGLAGYEAALRNQHAGPSYY